MILQTKRLLLRPWCVEDAEDLYRLARDPRVGEPAGWMPHTDVEHSREILCTVLSHPTVWAVCQKDGRPIGNIYLDFGTPLRERDDECELGYWLGTPFWGQGLMTEAARALLRYAFDELHVHKVWSGYYDGNDKSRRVQQKLGFVRHHTDKIRISDVPEQTRTVHRTCLTRMAWEISETTKETEETE